MKNNIDCIILAAGLSSRMLAFKPLLLYNNITFLENIINKVITYIDKIIVVTGFNSINIEQIIKSKYDGKQVYTVYNKNYNSSMYYSLLKGIEQITNNNFALYHFIDQPTIPADFYPAFLSQIDKNDYIIQPTFNNKKGHPLLFSFNFCKHLLISDVNSNLKIEMQKFENLKKYWNCEFKEILKDYDTLEDYKVIEENNNGYNKKNK